jgi:hypothetical protein
MSRTGGGAEVAAVPAPGGMGGAGTAENRAGPVDRAGLGRLPDRTRST